MKTTGVEQDEMELKTTHLSYSQNLEVYVNTPHSINIQIKR